jgi:hypothetical protein
VVFDRDHAEPLQAAPSQNQQSVTQPYRLTYNFFTNGGVTLMELEAEDALSEFDLWGRTELEIGSRIRTALSNDRSSKFLLRAADKALKILYRTCAQERAMSVSLLELSGRQIVI